MPRVNVGRDRVKELVEEQNEAARRIIRRGMAEQGIKSDKEVAAKMGLSAPSFSRRMADGSWRRDELIRLFKLLHLTERDAGIVLGVESKR